MMSISRVDRLFIDTTVAFSAIRTSVLSEQVVIIQELTYLNTY